MKRRTGQTARIGKTSSAFRDDRVVMAMAVLGIVAMVGMGAAPALSETGLSGLSIYELYQGDYLDGARDLGGGVIAIGSAVYAYETVATLTLLASLGIAGIAVGGAILVG